MRKPHYEGNASTATLYSVEREESTGELLGAVGRALRQRLATATKEYGVTPSQARALHVIVEHGTTRPSEIADALRIVPRSATEVIDALESHGLVTREPDPTDRRALRIAPTAEGRRLADVLARARRTASDRLLADLSERDRSELDRILRLLLADR